MTVSTGRRPGIMSVVVCSLGHWRQSRVPRRGHRRGLDLVAPRSLPTPGDSIPGPEAGGLSGQWSPRLAAVREPPLTDAVEVLLVLGTAEARQCGGGWQPHWFATLENEPHAPGTLPSVVDHGLDVLPGDAPPADPTNIR